MTAKEAYIGDPLTRVGSMSRSTSVEPLSVRLHVQSLLDSGMTYNMIARAAGISAPVVSSLAESRSRYVLTPTAKALLGVTQRPVKHQALVLGYGVRRRLEGLAVMGWSIPAVAHECGLKHSSTLFRARNAIRVQWRVHQAVSEGYERISHVRREDPRTLNWAKSKGFIHPFMWDDVDDYFEVPGSAPADVGVDEVLVQRVIDGTWVGEIPSPERRAAFEKLHARGLSAIQIAERLHVTPRTVERLRAAA